MINNAQSKIIVHGLAGLKSLVRHITSIILRRLCPRLKGSHRLYRRLRLLLHGILSMILAVNWLGDLGGRTGIDVGLDVTLGVGLLIRAAFHYLVHVLIVENQVILNLNVPVVVI